ncbi:MAG: isopentenyl diphosphate isomerase/L-lactate dehydrogenase-like FMN-dependent dehydrogenase [Pseudohongiellaceae bacterium]|jgi:isopentenyl diphosphate isomerase/L-lactate dehydrogenase-like FMN-dependent dehydrogenase
MFSFSPIYTTADARRLAKKKLPWMVYDYIDGSAGEGLGDQLNRQAIQNLRLQPRVLKNVEHRSLAGNLFGVKTGLPFGIAPMGMCNLSAPGADLMLARLAAKHNIPVGVSTAASTPLEKMIETAEGHAWFQLYFGGDEAVSDALVNRAEACGYDVLTLTVDVAEVGRRPRELRRGFKMPFRIGPSQFIDFAMHPSWSLNTLFKGPPDLANFGGDTGNFDRTKSRAGADWGFLERMRERWKGKLVVKGVLSVADSLKIKAMGVDAVQVSSHGGRQLESAPPAINALSDIRDALGDDFPIFYDSGIRNGEDIIKAYAKGADFVMLGRPLLFAMAANGEKGLADLSDVFSEEISLALALLGMCSIDEVSASIIS